MSQRVYTVPMLLTVVRLFSPLIMPFFILHLWPYPGCFVHVILVGLFLLLGLTDVLDGYLARRFGEVTKLGQILDPIADKFLVVSSLLALFAVHAIGFFWVTILILREVFVMAVRYVACEHGTTISVSWLSKIKTWLQLVLILFLLSCWGMSTTWLSWIVYDVLVLATVGCSLYAAYEYYIRCVDVLFRTYDF